MQTIKTAYYQQLLKQVGGTRKESQSLPFISSPAEITSRTPNTQELKPDDIPKFPQPKENFRKSTGRITALFKTIASTAASKLQQTHVNAFPLAKLIFKSGDWAGRSYSIRNINPPDNPAGFVRLGRSPQEKDHYILLNKPTVSRLHATVAYRNQKLVIVNHSTVNPTRINSTPIQCEEPVYLPPGAIINVGSIEFTVEKLY